MSVFLGIRVVCQILMFVEFNRVNEIGLRMIRLKNAVPNNNKIPIRIIDLIRGSKSYKKTESSMENEEDDKGSPTE